MDLASPKTVKLIIDLAKGIKKTSAQFLHPYFLNSITAGKWLAGSNYWTAGQKFTHENDSFGWCVGQSMLPLMKNSTLWAEERPGNSSNGRNCILFRMNRANKNAPIISLSDKNCTYKYMFSCQVILFCANAHSCNQSFLMNSYLRARS